MTQSSEQPEGLPPAELAMLTAYRAERGMPAAAKDRLIARLEAADTAPAATAGVSGRWVAAGVAVAAALVLGWGLSNLRSEGASEGESGAGAQAAMHEVDEGGEHRASEREPEPRANLRRPEHSRQTAPNPAPTEDLPQPSPPEPDPSVEGSPVESPAVAPEPPATTRPNKAQPRRRPTTPQPEAPAVHAPTPSQLSQERAILSRAWKALADGDHRAAMRAADEHAERFGAPTLGIERSAIATVARCKSKRPGWSAKATVFLDAHGKTPLARRVREACGFSEPAEEKSPTD